MNLKTPICRDDDKLQFIKLRSKLEFEEVRVLSIEEQFNRIAKEYDVNRRNFIPCFDEYYEATTNFIASNKNLN